MTFPTFKFATLKALQMDFRVPIALALGSENCVNFGLGLRKNHSVICVNFGIDKMLQQAQL